MRESLRKPALTAVAKIMRVCKNAVHVGDLGLQALGSVGIASSEMVGTVVLAPTEIKSSDVKTVVGGGILLGSWAFGMNLLLEKDITPLMVDLDIKSEEVFATGITLDYLVAEQANTDKAFSEIDAEFKALEASNIPENVSEVVPDYTPSFGDITTPQEEGVVIVANPSVKPLLIQPEILSKIESSFPEVSASIPLEKELKREKEGSIGIGQKEIDHLRKIINYEGSTPMREAFMNLAPLSQWKFYNLITDYHKATGELVNVKSAWRSRHKQRSLRSSMPSGMAANECGSAHAIGALDIDRNGRVSKQVAKMAKLGLLKKHRLWVPPEVREAWHVEDPDSVYFRYWNKDNPERGIYRASVCEDLTGPQHEAKRFKDGVFTIADSYRRVSDMADYWIKAKGITGQDAVFMKDYLLFSVRAESMYGRWMLSHTAAKGWWMFTDATAKQYNLKYPMQLRESARATIELAQDNIRSLQKYGIEVTVENVYLAHMVGAMGESLVLKVVSGESLSVNEESTFDKVVASNMTKENFQKFYTLDASGKAIRNPGVSVGVVASLFVDFFDTRFKEYHADNRYVKTLVG